ncbi:MAG: hypothetical protein ACE37F_31085 [Nannocystaceae bacterium]|nr:hypothetical protein [bacterium]
MRDTKLTLILVGLFGAALPAAGCFITTESDEYTDTEENNSSSTPPDNPGPCEIGAPGCPCTGSGTCDPGLQCVENTSIGASWCLLPDCTGALGCECTSGGTCDEGLLCADIGSDPGVCVSDDPCLEEEIGIEGCQCTMGGGCNPGLECVSDLCVDLPDDPGTSTSTTDDPTDTTTGDGSTTDDTAGDVSTGGGGDTSGGATPTTGS